MKYYNGLNMGEGLAGPTTIGMATTVIYTCMGIAFVNTTTKIGGLYHYPANTLNNANVKNTILQMGNDIRPDQIVLTPAKDASAGYGSSGSSKADIEAVAGFLQTICKSVATATAGTSADLTWDDKDAPVFNAAPVAATTGTVSDSTRNRMSTGRREVEGNVWYYGGNGEVDGVLEQGLQTTKQTADTCCILM